MKKWLAKIMVGRYGVDPLTNFLLIVSMVLLIVSMFFGESIASTVLWVAALALLAFGYYRIFSKQTSRGVPGEPEVFAPAQPVYRAISLVERAHQAAEDAPLFKCPQCGVTVRVPKGKGKIKITCPKCRTTFVRNT